VNADKRGWILVGVGMESVDYSFPLDFGFLEVDEEAVGEAVYAFQFDQELVFDHDIRHVVAYGMAFVGDWK
jgi:hypothetical protein